MEPKDLYGLLALLGMMHCLLSFLIHVGTNGDLSFGEAFWWPLLIAKAILKGLYVVMFTGWKETP